MKYKRIHGHTRPAVAPKRPFGEALMPQPSPDYASLVKTEGNSRILAGLWSELVNPEKRMRSEGPFLLGHLNSHGCTRVFDSCLGMGATSVYLLQAGYRVLSNEIDQNMLEEARRYSAQKRVMLDVCSYDWREMPPAAFGGKMDAVLCLGNSLTYLFGRREQLGALSNFRRALRDGGTLIIDTRNYPRMLRGRDRILNRPDAFRDFNRYVYCGTDAVPITPLVLEEREVVFKYTHPGRGEDGYLRFYPFGEGEMRGLLEESGFANIRLFSDYKEGFSPDADFHQFLCECPFPTNFKR